MAPPLLKWGAAQAAQAVAKARQERAETALSVPPVVLSSGSNQQLKGTDMTRTFFDSAAAPTQQTAALARIQRKVSVWGFYCGGKGAVNVWQPEDIAAVKAGGIFEGIPIYVPDLNLDGPASTWVPAALAGCRELGVVPTCLALDTEKVEQGNPNLRADVDQWNSDCRKASVAPIIYSGAGYNGDSYLWLPKWVDGVPGVASDEAQQYIGNLVFNGMEVDVSIAGEDFPIMSLLDTIPVFRATFPELTVGSEGPYVAFLMGFLTTEGFYGLAHHQDPVFGDETKAALEDYQHLHGNLTVDGVCGPETWSAIVGSGYVSGKVDEAPVDPTSGSPTQEDSTGNEVQTDTTGSEDTSPTEPAPTQAYAQVAPDPNPATDDPTEVPSPLGHTTDGTEADGDTDVVVTPPTVVAE
jgi:hypothetical protein